MNAKIEIQKLEKEIEEFDSSWDYRNSLIEYWLKRELIVNKINSLKYLSYRNEKQ